MQNEDLRRVACLLYLWPYIAEGLYFSTLLLARSRVGLSSATCLTHLNVELSFLDLEVDTSRRWQTAIKRLLYALAVLPIEDVIHRGFLTEMRCHAVGWALRTESAPKWRAYLCA